jgi:hypothetical protein
LKETISYFDNHQPLDERHPQFKADEGLQLWELAIEYPPLYEAVEGLFIEASDMSASETLKEIIHAYQKTEEETFKKIAFERILNDRFGHNVKEILRLLNETHGSTFTPKRVPLGLDFISDERQLELIVLNIIAGALIAYHIPEVYEEDGKNAGALKQLHPSEKVIKLSQKLYKAIRDDRLWVGDFKHSLWDLSQGEPLETQLQSSEKPKIKLEYLVKEITLLSERHLTMRTKGKGRFPTLAVIEISKIVQHFPEPDVRTVSPIQKKYAKKYKEEPLAKKWMRFFVSPDL